MTGKLGRRQLIPFGLIHMTRAGTSIDTGHWVRKSTKPGVGIPEFVLRAFPGEGVGELGSWRDEKDAIKCMRAISN